MSIWTKLRDTVVGGVTGFLTGGPSGAVLGTIGANVPTRSPAVPAVIPGAGAVQTQSFLPSLNLPGGNYTGPGLFVPEPGAAAGSCPPGWHLDKKTRSYCVRNRTMNPMNPKANMRAVRRLTKYHNANKKIEKALRRLAPPSRRRR